MAKDGKQPAGSALLLDEYFAAGDDAFLAELRGITDLRKLAGFADRWKIDPRPWARAKIFDYLAMPLSTPGHNVLVKRLFKQAERNADHELMGAFLHAFDCLVRRVRAIKYGWDRAARQATQEEFLRSPRDAIVPLGAQPLRNPITGDRVGAGVRRRTPGSGRIFSYRTRYYLRRRAWRYFRFLGYRSPADYRPAIADALARYVDDDLAAGENILDSWCLLNACYRHHPALTFTPNAVRLNEGRSLNDLSPAPKFPATWNDPAAADVLWNLLVNAGARLMRVWTIRMLQDHHAAFLATLAPQKLIPLFDSVDDEIQQFAATALESAPGLDKLPISTWLELLGTRDAAALETICRIMERHVTPDRLDLGQTARMTNAVAVPVARLGLRFLRSRRITSAADRQTLSDLADARAGAVAAEITTFALSILGTRESYDVALVSRFFDSLSPAVRSAAWGWLAETSPGYNDPALWARLLETPYEDVRLRLVKVLESRRTIPGADAEGLSIIWSSVLLGIHRGGRQKISALHQISRTLLDRPDAAERLLPIVAVAIRSVRPAEACVGLAAVVRVVERNPALAASVAAAIPELRMVSEGATA